MTTELPWQKGAWQLAAKALAARRLPAGLLILGSPGVGREALALRIAAARLCPNRTADQEACGRCASCRQLAAGTHPEVLHLRPVLPGEALKVDPVRELSRALALTSGPAGARCAVISPADKLTTAAANALLKTLEEPPPGVCLMLIGRSTRGLQPTVLSRCLRLSVPTPSVEVAVAWLQQRQRRDDWPMLLALAAGGPFEAERLAAEEKIDAAAAVADLVRALEGQKDPVAVADQLQHWDPRRLAVLVAWLVRQLLRRRTSRGTQAPEETGSKSLDKLMAVVDPQCLARAGREAIRLGTDDPALNAALAREHLVLSLVAAFSASQQDGQGR